MARKAQNKLKPYPIPQTLLEEGRGAAQRVRVVLGYFPEARRDLRALLFALDEGKAVDLSGLEASHRIKILLV